MSQEFKIVQNTGNVSYISSAIYSTHARPERRRREGHCETNANAWRSSPFQNIVIPLFFSFIFVQIFSNLSTVLYPHLWYKFNLHILPKSFGANIQHKYIFWNIYIPQLCARRANRNYPTYIHPPNCLHDVSNQNIYQTDIYSPNCWQYIFNTNIYFN